MSRIGKKPIEIPAGVKVTLDGNVCCVEGPKGKLEHAVHANTEVAVEANTITVSRKDESKLSRSVHGLTRTLVANMVDGVTKGFEKKLEIHGVGYRAAIKGKDLDLSLGFSHPVVVTPPEGIEFAMEGNTGIVVRGVDKQLVGQTAANIRKIRQPEPYKGKGIRYSGEKIIRKAGKTGKR
ncbi:50S ribosomal protein L6 [Geovibrio thiophilus]|uniref:Large ribosomal subunit protein uL6 n=1 Tax=Geovibrio thiophilus TaxID=139438 RepID=A0A3R5XX33_9BACT|nr:50S ribosomal protein L6 [Geovibrio thiophilus]QAR32793.1 50S ribosomal protein L6 [Geovibrio thiophilus]